LTLGIRFQKPVDLGLVLFVRQERLVEVKQNCQQISDVAERDDFEALVNLLSQDGVVLSQAHHDC
jgi:hypothetical protein